MKESTVWHEIVVIGVLLEHFVTKVCRCVKQKRPVLKVTDPLQPITSIAPFDLISIDFLHLDQSSGGYEYIMLIVDHFTKFVYRATLHEVSLDILQQKDCLMSISHALDSQAELFTTREGNLRIRCLSDLAS